MSLIKVIEQFEKLTDSLIIQCVKHLPGQHSQSAHGGGGSSPKKPSEGSVVSATRGKAGIWRTADGKPAPPHIQKIGIPPGWKDVQINTDPKADLLARGTDSKGRGQYKYSDNHSMRAAANKFGRVAELRKKRGQIFKEVDHDIKTGSADVVETASCTKLIMKTGMRPGSNSETGADHKAYGATTLEGRHIVQRGDKVVIKYVPGKKKGKEIERHISDPALASDLVARSKAAGSTGKLFDTDADKVSTYSKSKDGGGFKTKDHRTALGTETAIKEIKSSMVPPSTAKEYKERVKLVSVAVSNTLGNTPAIAFKSYIDPMVWNDWKRGAGVE